MLENNKASASQNRNCATWLQPNSYVKIYMEEGPRSKSSLVSVYFRQSGSLSATFVFI